MLGSTILEIIVTVVVVMTMYKSIYVGFTIIVGMVIYFYATYALSNWMKTVRNQFVGKDSKFHERSGDAIQNFELVK
jgi:ABC-type transport system involved in Fe-S cluster assembly fused permease/ATPase subunit